jgi:hypothetical protein
MSNYQHVIDTLKLSTQTVEAMQEQAHQSADNTSYLTLHISFCQEIIDLYTRLRLDLEKDLMK